jgi:LDH2 family malate/lactate/ureidoglycolate dehydrogenase
MNQISISSETLQGIAERILASVGAPAHKAALMAEGMVTANLRGVDSHGIQLLPAYVKQLRVRNIDPDADGHIVSESGSCLVYDGENGIGHYISSVCCSHSVRLAQQYGLGLVISRNSSHFGAAAVWGQRISAAGMMGIVMTNASPSVSPWQGREGRIGTNPICVCLPGPDMGRWQLDMATTTVAMNKVVKAASEGKSTIPAGWAMDRDGIPTQDAQEALAGLLMPLGGYKGSGLGVMVEILCAVLGGGPISAAVGGLYVTERKMGTSHMFLAIDVARFLPLPEFQSRMERLVSTLKSARPAQGYEEVLVAGDPEWRMEELRRREGIPIDGKAWERIRTVAQECGVPLEG